jgi:hypothetical protein
VSKTVQEAEKIREIVIKCKKLRESIRKCEVCIFKVLESVSKNEKACQSRQVANYSEFHELRSW